MSDTGVQLQDRQAVDELFATTYAELRRLARSRLRSGGRSTVLDTTALVHETYLRLSRSPNVPPVDRPRFFAYAGQVMRSVIVDLVRRRVAECRGGDLLRVTWTGDMHEAAVPAGAQQILQVHEALDALVSVDPRMARVVEMRYFGGLSDEEIGEALGIAARTVRHDWEHARLFLAEALR